MDALQLIDRLDDAVRDGASARLGAQVRLDRQEIYDLLAEIRAKVPEEIRQARYITEARQEFLDEAREEAERIVAEAREERSRVVDPDRIAEAAAQRAARIVEMAESSARQIRLGAEGYADEILGSLEKGLGRMAAVDHRGLSGVAG